MLKGKNSLIAIMFFSLVIFMSVPAYAKSFSMKDAGIALWIFIIIGAIIILLQLVPAAILFFSFVGSTSAMVFKRKKVSGEEGVREKEKLALPGYEPAPVEK